MRPSTVVTLSVLAAAAPALSVPLADGTYARELLSRSTRGRVGARVRLHGGIGGHVRPPFEPLVQQIQQRELEDLVARAAFEDLLARDDESGAINFFKFIPTVAKHLLPFLGGNDSPPPPAPPAPVQRRELEDIVTREVVNTLLARGDIDESGAINFGGIIRTIPKIIEHVLPLFGGNDSPPPPPAPTQQRREVEILARDIDESGAINLKPIFKGIPKVLGPLVPALLPSVVQQFLPHDPPAPAPPAESQPAQRRDLEELVIRAITSQQNRFIPQQQQSVRQGGRHGPPHRHHGHHHHHHQHQHGNGDKHATPSGSSSVVPKPSAHPTSSSAAPAPTKSAVTASSSKAAARSLNEMD